jgi:phosphoribosylformylglycinamidine cyclo-ligase
MLTHRDQHRISSYSASGVDISAGNRAKEAIGRLVQRTFTPDVIGRFGHFGSFFRAPGDGNRAILVSSADSVGTKVLLAMAAGRHRGIGIDLVNHCVNDILACGARPLFFLDYFASAEIDQGVIHQLIDGMSQACKDASCALIGGETAQLPDIYLPGCYDLAGFIVGVVHEDRVIDGSAIVEGDTVVGLPSNGLHTNGYSLARSVIGVTGDVAPEEARAILSFTPPQLGVTLDDALLRPHRSYLSDVLELLDATAIHCMAHITGGGIAGNLGRVVPRGLMATVDTSSWKPPAIFAYLQDTGPVTTEEMFNVFNMGIGFVLVVDRHDSESIVNGIPGALVIGEVRASESDTRVEIIGSTHD